MNTIHEPSIPTKLKACAALLLEGEAIEILHEAVRPWLDLNEIYECWVGSSCEELATFLLFVAEAERQG